MRQVDPESFERARRGGAAVFDTRPPAQAARAPLAGSRPLPLAAVQRGRFPDEPKDAPLYLVCGYGRISQLVGMYLEAAGYHDVYNLQGGLAALDALEREREC